MGQQTVAPPASSCTSAADSMFAGGSGSPRMATRSPFAAGQKGGMQSVQVRRHDEVSASVSTNRGARPTRSGCFVMVAVGSRLGAGDDIGPVFFRARRGVEVRPFRQRSSSAAAQLPHPGFVNRSIFSITGSSGASAQVGAVLSTRQVWLEPAQALGLRTRLPVRRAARPLRRGAGRLQDRGVRIGAQDAEPCGRKPAGTDEVTAAAARGRALPSQGVGTCRHQVQLSAGAMRAISMARRSARPGSPWW